jgi:type IV pilus assembly protein PilW
MRGRGFTLIELLVGATISTLAITMVLFIFLSQNKAFVSLDLARDANGSGRDAALEMQSSLKRAGFGIDPSLAFDFTCPVGSNCHDRVNAPDDVTFYARNPQYVWSAQNSALGCNTVGGCFGGGNIWPITAATSTSVSVTLGAKDVMHKGSIVLAVCANGASPVFATVTTRQAGSGLVAIPVSINTTGLFAGNAFQACHSTAGSALFLIDKFHYFVTVLNSEPWLMLDTGLDYDADGILPPTDVNDLVPVARDVEDMQVAYQIGQAVNPPFAPGPAPDSNADWVVANQPGTQEEPSTAAVPPLGGASSGTLHPGNIRAVRVTLVIRSRTIDRALRLNGGDPAFKSENRNDVTAVTVSQFRRFPQTFSVATRNMTVSNPYLLF